MKISNVLYHFNIIISISDVLVADIGEEQRLRVFQNRVLREILGRRRDEVTGDWRKLHNEELNDVYCSPNIVRVIKSRMMGEVCSAYGGQAYSGFRWGNLRERGHFVDPGIDGRIILRWIFRK